jgi:hypothetical protein
MSSRALPLDRWLLENRRGALILAAALGAFVPICWMVIQLNGSFPGDDRRRYGVLVLVTVAARSQ